MSKFYWQGSKEFPEEAGELVFQPVRFDSTTGMISYVTEVPTGDNAVEEYLITGVDEQWLVTQQFRGLTIPVSLTRDDDDVVISEESYTITDDKILAKIRRFAQNREQATEMRRICKRTVY